MLLLRANCFFIVCAASRNEVRLSWLEDQVERAPSFGTPVAAAAPPTGEDAGDDNSEPAVADGDLASDGEAVDQQREAGTSPAVAWASPEEERERLAASRRSSNGGGAVTDEEVERLRCRMDRVESRIYQRCADTRRRQSQVCLYTRCKARRYVVPR